MHLSRETHLPLPPPEQLAKSAHRLRRSRRSLVALRSHDLQRVHDGEQRGHELFAVARDFSAGGGRWEGSRQGRRDFRARGASPGASATTCRSATSSLRSSITSARTNSPTSRRTLRSPSCRRCGSRHAPARLTRRRGNLLGKNNRTLLPASVARTAEAVSISAPATDLRAPTLENCAVCALGTP